MPEKTIKHEFYNWVDEDGLPQFARKGETVDFDDDEAERGDSLGAFEDSPEVDRDLIRDAFGQSVDTDPESGVAHQRPPKVSDDAAAFPEEEEPEDEPERPDPTGEDFPDLADKDDSGEVPRDQGFTNVASAEEQKAPAKRAAKKEEPKASAKPAAKKESAPAAK